MTAGEYRIGDDGLVEDEQTGVVTDVRSCRQAFRTIEIRTEAEPR